MYKNINTSLTITNSCNFALCSQNPSIQLFFFIHLFDESKFLHLKFQGYICYSVSQTLILANNSTNGEAIGTMSLMIHLTHKGFCMLFINNDGEWISACRIGDIKYNLCSGKILWHFVEGMYNLTPATKYCTPHHYSLIWYPVPAPATFAKILIFSSCSSRRACVG